MTHDDRRGALFSDCGYYRYRLWRCWDMDLPRCAFIMLNPSTADAATDDPTILKCVKLAKAWGFGGIEVINLFAWRATDPDQLRAATRPGGSDNDSHIKAVIASANVGRVVLAWGARGRLLDRDKEVLAMLFEAECFPYALKLNRDGSPAHPLYQRDDAECIDFPVERLFEATLA